MNKPWLILGWTLFLVVVGWEVRGAETLIPRGAVWKYLDNGSDQGTAWREPGFNDSAWPSGPAQLGYGDGDEATVVNGGPSNNRFVTTYFRRAFNVANPAGLVVVQLQVQRDDGVAVYLNGVEVFRNNLGTGAVLFDTFAANAGDDGRGFLAAVPIDRALLVSGANVLAAEIHQSDATSSDITFDLELTGSRDNFPPAVQLTSPVSGRAYIAPADIPLQATATDSEGNLAGIEFYAGGVLRTNLTTSPFAGTWSGVPIGTYSVYAVGYDALGARGTSAVATVTVSPSTPPTVVARSPLSGPVNSLRQLAVTFSEPVSGVRATDLLINGQAAASVSGAGSNYTFGFPQPADGTVTVAWDPRANIIDFEPTPRAFDPYGVGARWQYTLVDTLAPLVATIFPAPGSTVRGLTEISVTFNEPVSGVDPADLRVNNVPATAVAGSGAGPYRFQWASSTSGAANVSWSSGHGIRDLASAPNAFAGGTWAYTVNAAAGFAGAILINEIMYHPATTLPADEWIELLNRGTTAVSLNGWAFTRGVNFTFPAVTLPAGGLLVVAADLAAFRARYPGVTNVIGGWTGQLNNTDEEIELEDASGDRVDLVHYHDEGDSGYRRRTPGQSFGWEWYAEHDGLGKSLELRQAALSNDADQNWMASVVAEGTPGRANSTATTDLPPMILSVTHAPAVPKSGDPIRITARLVDELATGLQARVWWRNASTTNPPAFAEALMFDDGLNGDGGAGDGVFGAVLPPQADRTVIEFFVAATDAVNQLRSWPAAVESSGALSQSANALVQVDNTPYDGRQPIYRVLMTEADRVAFAGQNRSIESLVNCTLVAIEDGKTQIRYGAGLRYRGAGSRGLNPPTYRLDIPSDRRWGGRTALNLNSQFVYTQVLGSQVAIKAGLVTEYARAVQLRLNGANPANAGSSQFGSYAAVEPTGAELIANHLPDDAGGNVYRASTGNHSATLEYLGTNSNAYVTAGYQKNSNGSENDWSDLINLTFALDTDTTPGNEYAAAVRRNLNVEAWLRYFVVGSLMAYTETALTSGSGDDYGLYRGEVDPRFIILAHDFDTVFGQAGSAGSVSQSIYVAGAVPTMNRFLRHPAFEPLFHEEFRRQLATTFETNSLFAMMDLYLGDWVPAQTIQSMKSFTMARIANVLGQLPPAPVKVTATIAGEPATPGYVNAATLVVGGVGVTHYRFRLNGAAYGAETPVSTPIQLSGLTNGTYTVSVIGRDAGGNWQAESSATMSVTWTVLSGVRPIVINEILAHNVGAVNQNGAYPDMVELFNPRPAAVDLTGWRLTDDLNEPARFVFPAGTGVPAGGYLVLSADNAVASPGLHLGFGLGQDGDALHLLDPAGRTVDSIEFGFQLADRSIGRNAAGRWVLGTPTLGAGNAAVAVGVAEAVRINEYLANGAPPFLEDFVELYNPQALPVDVGGLYLTDRVVGRPEQHRIVPLSFLPDFGYRAFVADGNGGAGTDHLNFKLDSEQGEIGLLGPGAKVLDVIVYGPQPPGISEGRAPNGGVRIVALSSPTPGAPNPVPPAPIEPQLVNLIPLDATVQWRYEGTGTDLGTSWAAPGFDDSAWPSGPPAFGFDTGIPEPLRTPLQVVNGRITFYFRTRFALPSGLEVSGLQATHLTDDGAVFYLNGSEAGRFNMPAAPAVINNGTLAPNSHEANVFETTALSLAGLSPGENVIAVEVHQNTANSSDIVFGLRLDAVVITNRASSAGIKLNEVLANNRSVTNSDGTITDWVELSNPSSGPVDLAGMSLTDQVADSRRWVFPAGSIVAAGGYRVVRFDDSLPASTNATDVLNTGFGLNASGDEIYLFNRPVDGGELLDSLVFGVQAPDFSLGRIPDGGTNWALALPTPGSRNLAAALGPVTQIFVNEWMADPLSGEDWFELYNGAGQPAAIGGLFLTDDLNNPTKSPIPALSFLGIGLQGFQRFDADNNPAAGGDHVAFRLAAGGESIALASTNGLILTSVTFGAQTRGVAEGRLPDGASSWARFPGTASPGNANYALLPNVVINEALTHTDSPLEDAIELHNPSSQGVDLSGWFLSDRRSELRLFQIPNGTVLGPGGFLVFYEYQFNPDFSGLPPAFGLSSASGDEIILSQVNEAGALTGLRATAEFGAARNGVSFGRHLTSTGADFTAMSRRSLGADSAPTVDEFRTGRGAANPLPLVGRVVVSEIHYHPAPVSGADREVDEFIELVNVSSQSVPLFDPANPANTWRLRDAVDYEFGPGVTLSPGGRIVVVGFDPVRDPAALAEFRRHYAVTASVSVVGPWRGRLQDSSDNVELYQPDIPQLVDGFVPYVLADKVRYADAAPWPPLADGATNGVGYSLNRVVAAAYGNEATNWVAAVPTPGGANAASVINPPVVQSITPPQNVNFGVTATMVATAIGAGPLSYQWFREGSPISGATNVVLNLANFQPANVGLYSIVVMNSAGSAYAVTRLDGRQAPVIVRQPVDVGAPQGGTARLSVVVAGTPPLTYQWQKNGVDVSGATDAVLVVANAQEFNQGTYRVVVANAFGTVTSGDAILVVQEPPAFVVQPQGADLIVGGSVTLSVVVTGATPLRFQWQRNGVAVPDATNSTLVLSGVRSIDAGSYRVIVSNLAGTVVSELAAITVSLPPTISIVASDASAGEAAGESGAFTLNRTGSLAGDVLVNLTLGGSAVAGTDYQTIAGPIVIPAGSNAVVVPVLPLNDSGPEGTESVVATVVGGAGYELGSPLTATVLILDDDNRAPQVSLVSPAAGSVVGAPATVTIAADAVDPEGALARVEFYLNGTNKVGELSAAPFSITVSNLPAGVYQLVAVAHDALGAFGTSRSVQLIVNAAPSVRISSPGSGAVFGAPASIPITVSASDTDGNVTRVELYVDGVLLAGLTSAPYAYLWTNVAAGSYTLTARAVDNRGATNASVPIVISVVPVFADLFDLRGSMGGFTNRVRGTNTTYTREPGEPRHENRAGTKSAWISWQAPASGTVSLDTFGSSFDTVLTVYTGTALTNLVRVSGNDDANELMVQSALSFAAVADVSYQIAVDGFSATAGGTIELRMEMEDRRPRIVAQPQGLTVDQGANATFSVTASGVGPLSYRWRFNGAAINNATNTTFTRSAAQSSHAGTYSVIVSNAFGTVTSAGAQLIVRAAPAIAAQPTNAFVVPGGTAVFSVVASGSGPLTYQWQKEGVSLAGATNESLTLAGVKPSDEGSYAVVVSNPIGATPSQPAVLQVLDGLVTYAQVDLVTMSNVWAYDQSGVDRGSAWRAPAFDDSSWPAGPGLFGSEDSVPYPYAFPLLTPLNRPDRGGPITVYFRTRFAFAGSTSGVTLVSESLVDDGVLYYLNGAEVGRVRMSANATNFSSLAQGATPEGQGVSVTFPASALVPGANVLAAEVHQSSATSTDVVFGMGLRAFIARTNGPALIEATRTVEGGFSVTLEGLPGRSYALEAASSMDGPWTRVGTFPEISGRATHVEAMVPTETRFYRGRLLR